MAKRVTRVGGAYEEEPYYTTTPVTPTEGKVHVNAHLLLEYARARLDVARLLAADFRDQSQTAVVGFLTGSLGLLATARELLEPLHPGRFKLAMGLAHAAGGDDGERELHEILSELHGRGVRRIILVDEVKGGSQMTTGLQSALRWARVTRATDVQLSAIGVSGARRRIRSGLRQSPKLVEKAGIAGSVVDPRTVTTTALVEMDTEGLKFRGVTRTGVGEYDFRREQPDKGLHVTCRDGGPSGGAGVRSLDAAFAGTVNRILGLSNPAAAAQPFDVGTDPDVDPPTLLTWPDTIEQGACETCRTLLAAARVTAQARHHWTSVAAYYLSERAGQPSGRALEFWLGGDRQARQEAARLGRRALAGAVTRLAAEE